MYWRNCSGAAYFLKAMKEPSECLLQVVGDAMKAEPSLEAVKLDHKKRAISIATLGKPQVDELEDELTHQISEIEKANCALLRGEKDCGACEPPNSKDTLRFLNIRQEG